MASPKRRFAVVLLLFFLVASSTAVPVTRSLIAVRDQDSAGNIHSQVAEMQKKDEVLVHSVGFVEGRMNLEVADYSGAGANNRHEPGSPGRN